MNNEKKENKKLFISPNTKGNSEGLKELVERMNKIKSATGRDVYTYFNEVLIDTEKSITVGKDKFKYIPNMIFLSDGAATDMLEGVWSNPLDEDNNLKSKGFSQDLGSKNI